MNEPVSEKSSSEPSYSSKLSRLGDPLLFGGDEAKTGSSVFVGAIGSYVFPCGVCSSLLQINYEYINYQKYSHCFPATFSKGGQTSKHYFLAMFPSDEGNRKHCFLAMFPKGEPTRKHCFLAMFPKAEPTRKHCFPAMFPKCGQTRSIAS